MSAEASQGVASVIAHLADPKDKPLLDLTEAELRAQWTWAYNAEKPPEWNLYEFHCRLEMFKRKCRQWETIHNGDCCVVERVRAKYLMPHIKTFLAAAKAAETASERTSHV